MIRWITENIGGSRAPEPEELCIWQKEGVNTVINLLKGSYGDFIAEKQKESGFEVIRIPFNMYDPIPEEDFLAVYEYIDQLLKQGKKVVAHCKYGKARSGTFLAGYLIYKGKDYNSAIDEVLKKGFLPQTENQLKFLQNLYRKLNGSKNS
ncbi:protein-tyrosine phosphatase family protein [Hydrogenothermus marinus]|uniref:Protein-tyrosine phosphatase n=1 Tax=Hydrogenothermus marinus TaxID=133270 RepID=A0A3M0BK67_9AQUI|nr:dual specificity protein phosphatase [Hydrogenothermus marinus]RMA97577.1 protein-tyrosine phosphatase [Hydrogenothermus marinus]